MRSNALLIQGRNLLLAATCAVGCASSAADTDVDEGAFSSNEAVLLEFEFDGEVVSDSPWKPIDDQLLYTVGQLNGERSVGRLDTVKLTNVEQSATQNGETRIRYHAVLQVAWGNPRTIPASYTFVLPRSVGYAAQRSFTEQHKHECVDWGAHDVDEGSMWYYYRPLNDGCALADAEVVKSVATVRRSSEQTTDKYPEYQKIWEDGRLEVIAIFVKYKDGATSNDAGISAYNEFADMLRTEFARAKGTVTTTPASIPRAPGIGAPDITYEAALGDGKVIKVTALLVDNIGAAPESFDRRYEVLSPTADLIAYNGHAGLGQNVRALAQKGRWKTGQYQVFFMNGCDTFAYVDGTLAGTRAALNPDDPTGTKYMEFVTNAMPSFFTSMPEASRAIVKGFLSYEQPMTYEQIFKGIDRAEVVLVTGEEDNVYRPGMPLGNR